MKTLYKEEGLEVILDPNDAYSLADPQRLIAACGIIPQWVIDSDFREVSIKEIIEACYVFGVHYLDKGDVDEVGVFMYPGDQPEQPILKIIKGEETLYQYLHSMVVFFDKDGEQYITRLD